METKAGTGISRNKDAYTAGLEAAEKALSHAGISECDFVFLYATVGYDQEQLIKGVRTATKNVPLSGCSTEGIITQDGPAGEVMVSVTGEQIENNAAGVMVFSSGEIKFTNYYSKGLKENSLKAGKSIAEEINDSCIGNQLALLMFVDSYTVNIKKLFNGLESTLSVPLLFNGGMASHHMNLDPVSYQYHNDLFFENGVSCVLVSGDVKLEIGVSHGCMPIGIEKEITKARENIVYEVDNKEAWNFFQEYLGFEEKELTSENSPSISIGVKLPLDLSTEYDRYIIRAPVGNNPDGSVSFLTEIPQSEKIQIIRRDEEKISNGAKALAERIKKNLNGKKPIAVLQFDCAGRGKMYFGELVKEKGIDVLQNILGKDIPWLGFYCFGEIAPIKGKNYYHNLTVSLCVFYK